MMSYKLEKNFTLCLLLWEAEVEMKSTMKPSRKSRARIPSMIRLAISIAVATFLRPHNVQLFQQHRKLPRSRLFSISAVARG